MPLGSMLDGRYLPISSELWGMSFVKVTTSLMPNVKGEVTT